MNKILQDLKERFLWLENLGYLNLIAAGVVGLLFVQYTFHLMWAFAIVYGTYKFFQNDVKLQAKFQKMVEEKIDDIFN